MGMVRDDLLLQHAGMRRAAVAVDVETVRRHADPNHLRAEFRQHGRRNPVGGTIGAIDDDFEVAEIEAAGCRCLDGLDVSALHVVQPLGAPDRRGVRERHVRRRHHERLDPALDGIRQLESVRAEQLDAVVLVRIVRSRDHHADIGTHRSRQEAHGGRRDRPQEKDIDAHRQEAGRQRLLQHVARQARILADDGAIAMGATAEHLSRGHADAHRHFGGHRRGIGAAANAVRAEK